jgi:hypothetical protein
MRTPGIPESCVLSLIRQVSRSERHAASLKPPPKLQQQEKNSRSCHIQQDILRLPGAGGQETLVVLVCAGDDQYADKRESDICQARPMDGEDLSTVSFAPIKEQTERSIAQKMACFAQDVVASAQVRMVDA